MSSMAENDAEDVNNFLKRIQELGTKRDQEDEERNRKLEEEILQGRKERQARRAERARSISPSKDSPLGTPTHYSSPSSSKPTLSPAPGLQPTTRDKPFEDTMDHRSGPPSPTKDNTAPYGAGDRDDIDAGLNRSGSSRASPSSAMPSRTPTLSWQQRRPNSQASDRPRSRPLSMIATENAARSPKAAPEPSPEDPEHPIVSRDQISQMLGSKDPAWFRQTAERGQNSPAYRKNQVEDNNVVDVVASSRVQLPGMSRESVRQSGGSSFGGADIDRSTSPSRNSSSNGSAGRSSYTSATLVSSDLGSPIPLTSAQRFDPPPSDRPSSTDDNQAAAGRALAMSPSQGRISPERLERSPSPTKGMGGFVQSAMMKRSDSVNKRWSVQSPPGLSRGNSIASNRSSYDATACMVLGGVAAREPRPSNLSRDNSPLPLSRPTSSHSNITIVQENERPSTSDSATSSFTTSTNNDGFVKPALPASRSHVPRYSRDDSEEPPKELHIDTTPPASPSKLGDRGRWSPTKSPTKSSWLESALNKPESPKPKATPPPSNQPAWMAEINKAKQRNADAVKSPPAPKHEVKIGGLIRSPPMGGPAKPLSIGGLPAGFSSGSVARNLGTTSTAFNAKSSASSSEALQRATGNKPDPTTSSTPASPPTSFSKPKPDTPAKKDFRANLKPRVVPSENPQQEPEFKNALGQLRRTKTQNYVAPDELKTNILRGKMELNITGGPKKTERKDEFKEAILKKKEDFKKAQLEGSGVKRPTSGSNQTPAPIPEALAKKAAMSKPATTSQDPVIESSNDFRKPSPPKESSGPGRPQAKEVAGSKLANRFNPALAGILARGPPSASNDTSRASAPAVTQRNQSTSATSDIAEAGPQLTHMTKARARGPRRKAPSNVMTSGEALSKPEVEARVESATSQNMTHRPALISSIDNVSKAAFSSRQDEPKKEQSQPSSPIKLDTRSKPGISDETENDQQQPASPRKLDVKRRSKFLEEVPNKNERTSQGLDSPKPLSPKKPLANSFEIPIKNRDTEPDELTSKSTSDFKSPPTLPLKPSQQQSKPLPKSPPLSPDSKKSRPPPLTPSKVKTPTPSKQVSDTQANIESESVFSVRNATSIFGNQNRQPPAALRSPIKLPTQADEDSSMIGAVLRSPEESGGRKQDNPAEGFRSVGPPTPSKLKVNSTPKDTGKPLPTPPAKPAASPMPAAQLSPSSPRKLQTQSSEASRLLTEFFGKNEFVPSFDVDTATVLSSKPSEGGKIKTLRSQLFQLMVDGKKQVVPSHQERILFEGNMYLCVHNFGTAVGKKITEVYFWAGDAVPDSVIEDADLFARREARSASGQLVKIRQGKETSEFIEALGGILITRRGTSNKYDSLAPHILCGRQFAGQIVFDEVEFSPSSLCSGFPYLIYSQSGKSFLWKGRGSSIDELSCARLIGMDIGLTGEIEEVEDGKEPASFLAIFGPSSRVMKSADHWRLKPSYQRYGGRLFCADSSAKSHITEITPCSQADISQSKIYVLDAFFEIYIIVGARSQTQFTSFCTALLFAQEYGILAAGMEDRPFVPVSTVILEGVPRDLKFVFRKWSDALTPTVVHSPTTTLSRGRSLRVVPLSAALDATRY